MDGLEKVKSAFREVYGQDPAFVVRSPGRVNLIGEHVDYNDGFVLPMAIDRFTWIAAGPRDDDRVEIHSADYGTGTGFPLNPVEKPAEDWGAYPSGVAWALKDAGYELKGWNGVTAGNVPVGAGLSSSASFQLAVCRVFATLGDWTWDGPKMAVLSQKSENQWVGVNCGIMDQMICGNGQEGMAVLIDCRSLELKAVPMPPDTAVVIMDTGTRRELVESAYNERRTQCETAASILGIQALRDTDSDTLAAAEENMDPVVYRRARHVVTEIERTEQAARVMEQGDAVALGKLMNQSHQSLKDDFEVTNDALDIIVDCARLHPGCLGARMSGAGFGGCAVALVKASEADSFVSTVDTAYRQAQPHECALYVCRASAGAEVIG